MVVAINLGLFGAVRRFRSSRGRKPQPAKGARGLQFRVAGALSGFAIVLFALGIIFTSNATSTPSTTSQGLTSFKGKPFEGPLVIKATGQQWLWRYNYPNGSFSYYKLVIPAHTEIDLKLESTDVVHTWNVADLAPKTDAVPGKVSNVVFRADAEGEFYGQSSTFAGQAYAPMRTIVEVVTPERFEEFIAEQQKMIRKGQESAEKIEAPKAAEDTEESTAEIEEHEQGAEGEETVGPEEEQESGSESSEEAEAEEEEPAAEGEESSEAEEGSAESGEAAEGGAEGGATADAAAGEEVFAENCSVCHGATGHGGNGGPDLRTMPLAKEQASAEGQVTNGGGGMPAFSGVLSEEEISNVAAYVVEDIVGGK